MKREWQQVRISDVSLGVFDGPHATPPVSNEGPVYLGIGNITEDGHLDLSDVRHIAEADFSQWTRRATPCPGDIVFTYEATLNRYAIIPEGFRGCLGRRTALLRPDTDKVDTRFLFYSFFSRRWRDTIEANRLSGSTVDRIPIAKFPQFPISLPSLDTQRRIASILGAYDDLIEVNQRRIAVLEEMARRLFEEWFVHFSFPGHEGHAMVETADGPLPEGWSREKLSDMCASIDYGYTASAEPVGDGPKFLRITDIVPSVIDWSVVPHCQIEEKRIEKYLLREGDIVVARTGATVGYAKRINKRHPVAVYASYLVRLRPLAHISNLMMGIFVQSDAYKAYVKSHAGGAAQPNANAKILTGVHLPNPPAAVHSEFQARVQPICDASEILQLQNAALAASRDLLLPRLISGEFSIARAARELEAVA